MFLKYSLLLLGVYQLASCAKLRCFKELNDYIEVDVDKARELTRQVNLPYFDITRQTYLFAPGKNFGPGGPIPTSIIKSLLNLPGSKNVVLVNWSKEASTQGLLGSNILSSPFPSKVKSVGEDVGEALAELASSESLKKEIRFIGFDYGAHLAGYSGKQAKENGLEFKEIIALDPNTIGFDGNFEHKPVDKTCAEFVSVVHCDPAGNSFNKSLGHTDFWPNFGNYDSPDSIRSQPGCPAKGQNDGSQCSHDRAVDLYSLALQDPSRFPAGKADSYQEFVRKDGDFDDNHINYLGPKINPKLRGDFFFTTSGKSPFSLGKDGLKAPKSD